MNSMADKKAAKREKMMNMPSYRLMVGTAKYMDKWFLDPILGFILPAGIAVLCWLIYLIISWAISLSTWAYDWIVSLF